MRNGERCIGVTTQEVFGGIGQVHHVDCKLMDTGDGCFNQSIVIDGVGCGANVP